MSETVNGRGTPLRAASVPFHSKALLGARVRKDDYYGLVMILRNFALLDVTHVFPWHVAPLSFAMNGFDSALHAVVAETRATDPKAITAAVRHVNLSGAAGPEAARRERLRIDDEEARTLRLREIFSASLCGHEGHVDELTGLLLPVGLNTSEAEPEMRGPLRKIHVELASFHEFTNMISGSEQILSVYLEIACHVRRTTLHASVLLNHIDKVFDQLKTFTHNWSWNIMKLTALVEELRWLLDGWDIMLDFAAANLFSLISDIAIVRKLAALTPPSPSSTSVRTMH